MAFDVEGARKAGYSDPEIANYLASQKTFDITGARKAGYGDQEIIGHLLGTQKPKERTYLEAAKDIGAGVVAGQFVAALGADHQRVGAVLGQQAAQGAVTHHDQLQIRSLCAHDVPAAHQQIEVFFPGQTADREHHRLVG